MKSRDAYHKAIILLREPTHKGEKENNDVKRREEIKSME